MKEKIRKFLVALKRKPHMIPLVVLGVAFLVYSMRLTLISNTTAKIQGPGMGLCGWSPSGAPSPTESPSTSSCWR